MASEGGVSNSELLAQQDTLCRDRVLAAAKQVQAILRVLVDAYLEGRSCSRKDVLEALRRESVIDTRKNDDALLPLIGPAVRDLREKLAKYYAEHPEDRIVLELPQGYAHLALPSQRRQKNPCLRASITDERAEWSYMKEVLASSDPARML